MNKLNCNIMLFLLYFTLHSCTAFRITVDQDLTYGQNEEKTSKEYDDLFNQGEKLIIVFYNFNKKDKLDISDYRYNYTNGFLICDSKNYLDPCKVFPVNNKQEIIFSINNKTISIPLGFVGRYKYLYVDLSEPNGSKKYSLNFSNHWKTKFNDDNAKVIHSKELEEILIRGIKFGKKRH